MDILASGNFALDRDRFPDMCHIGTKILDELRRQTRPHRSCHRTLTAGDTALSVPDVPVGRHQLIFDFASPFPHNAPCLSYLSEPLAWRRASRRLSVSWPQHVSD